MLALIVAAGRVVAAASLAVGDGVGTSGAVVLATMIPTPTTE